jgi:hypothetical protein
MSKYYLSNLNVKKIPEISTLVEKFGLAATNCVSKGFKSGFNPNEWYGKTIQIYVYREDFPLQIRTDFLNAHIHADPNLGLIKEIVTLVECASVKDDANHDYDMNLFR